MAIPRSYLIDNGHREAGTLVYYWDFKVAMDDFFGPGEWKLSHGCRRSDGPVIINVSLSDRDFSEFFGKKPKHDRGLKTTLQFSVNEDDERVIVRYETASRLRTEKFHISVFEDEPKIIVKTLQYSQDVDDFPIFPEN